MLIEYYPMNSLNAKNFQKFKIKTKFYYKEQAMTSKHSFNLTAWKQISSTGWGLQARWFSHFLSKIQFSKSDFSEILQDGSPYSLIKHHSDQSSRHRGIEKF